MMKSGTIHILKTGSHTDGNGKEVKFTKKTLKQITDSYDPAKFSAPIVLGHDMDDGLGRSDATPSWGWVKKPFLSPDGNSVYCEVDLSPQTVELLEKGHYKHVSVMLYDPDSDYNPTPGKMYIKHIALLGAHPPAIKGLDHIKYTEGQTMTVKFVETPEDFLNENVGEYLKYILADGENGFKGEIFGFNPEPSEENNWLYNEEEDAFIGVFNDGVEDYEFEIKKSGGGWNQVYSPVDKTEEDELPIEEAEDVLEDENVQLMEEEDDDELTALKEELTALKQQMASMEDEEDDEFVDSMFSEGKIVPSMVTRSDLKLWLKSLSKAKGTSQFSEGRSLTPKQFAKKLLKSLPQVISFGELAVEEVEDEDEDYGFTAADGTMPDPEQLEKHKKTMAYMEKKGLPMSEYLNAFKACNK